MKSKNELKREMSIEKMLAKTSERLFKLSIDSEDMSISEIQEKLKEMRMDIENVLQIEELDR